MAKSQSLNIVIGADIQNLKKGLDAAVVATEKAGKDMSGATGEAIKGMQDQFARLASAKPSMATVRQMQQIAMTARSLGPEFQQFANDVIREAGKIQDAVGDMRCNGAGHSRRASICRGIGSNRGGRNFGCNWFDCIRVWQCFRQNQTSDQRSRNIYRKI